MGNKIFQDDVGTVFYVDCGEDITAATKLSIKVKKPSGTLVEWIGSAHNTRYIKYVTVAGDLDEIGTHKAQSYVELPEWEGRGLWFKFKVEKIVDEV